MKRVLIDFSSQLDIIWSMKKRESNPVRANAIQAYFDRIGLMAWKPGAKLPKVNNKQIYGRTQVMFDPQCMRWKMSIR